MTAPTAGAAGVPGDGAGVLSPLEALRIEDVCATCHDREQFHETESGHCALCDFACPEFQPKHHVRAAIAAIAAAEAAPPALMVTVPAADIAAGEAERARLAAVNAAAMKACKALIAMERPTGRLCTFCHEFSHMAGWECPVALAEDAIALAEATP